MVYGPRWCVLRPASRAIHPLIRCLAVTPYIFSKQSEWKRLRALSLESKLDNVSRDITRITELLTTFRPPNLEDVTIHFLVYNKELIFKLVTLPPPFNKEDIFPLLEKALLTFRRQRLAFRIMAQAHLRKSRWIPKITGCFPILRDLQRLTIVCEPGEPNLLLMITDDG